MDIYKILPEVAVKQTNEYTLVINSARPFWMALSNKIYKYIVPEIINSEVGELLYRNGLCTKNDNFIKSKIQKVKSNLNDVETVLVLSLTERCNLHCGHCYIDAGNGKKSKEIDISGINSIIKTICESGIKEQISAITLIGGEPLLRSDIVEIIELINNYGFNIIISTNLTILTDDVFDAIIKSNAYVNVSIDGHVEQIHDIVRGKGNYNKTIENLNKFKKIKYDRIGFNVFVSNHNIDNLEGIFELAHNFNVNKVNANILMSVGRGIESKFKRVSRFDLYQKLFQIASKSVEYERMLQPSNFANKVIGIANNFRAISCGIGTNKAIYVNSEGEMYPCSNSVTKEFKVGNLLADDFSELWENSQTLNSLREINIDSIEYCNTCYLRYYCGGDCRAESYYKNGNLMQRHQNCRDIQRTIISIMEMLCKKPRLFEEKRMSMLKNAARI